MQVYLPDGSPLELPEGASGADAAAAIGPGLAKAALGVRIVDDGLHDLASPLPDGARVQIVTASDEDPDALWLIRHDAAHVLAEAVLELYPGVKISIGPPIEDGFYYDFEFPEGTTVSEADLERIEAKMREHIAADEPFVRSELPAAEAIERFRAEGQDYKVELIQDLIRDEGTETVSLYTNGPFTDLCRGPHGPSTKRITRAGPRPRPPQARPGAGAVHVQRALARRAVLGTERHGPVQRADPPGARGEREARL